MVVVLWKNGEESISGNILNKRIEEQWFVNMLQIYPEEWTVYGGGGLVLE